MNSEETIYISLQEATQYCNYSQEYLSLRARQGRLRALKFGRNWVIKKEWLEEYLKKVEVYNNNLKVKKFVAPPENLPIEETLKPVPLFWELKIRFGFVMVLVFVSLITGIFHSRESFKVVYDQATPLAFEFNENFNTGVLKLPENISSLVILVGGVGDNIVNKPTEIIFETVSTIPKSFQFVSGEINENFDFHFTTLSSEINSQLLIVSYPIRNAISSGARQTAGIGETVAESLKGYFQWLARQTFGVAQGIGQGYTTANNFIKQKLGDLARQTFGVGQKIVRGYVAANNFVEQKLGGLAQGYLAINDTLEKNLSQDVDDLVTGIKWLNSKLQKMVLVARDWAWEKWQFVIRPWREVPLVEEPLRPKPEEGAVVVPFPPEAKLAEVKGKLEKAFSDKVEVKPDVTGRAGVIKPLIKEAEAQEYLYLIVPVAEQSE